jgi:hypothetical protein
VSISQVWLRISSAAANYKGVSIRSKVAKENAIRSERRPRKVHAPLPEPF